jgi:hypothetical protein
VLQQPHAPPLEVVGGRFAALAAAAAAQVEGCLREEHPGMGLNMLGVAGRHRRRHSATTATAQEALDFHGRYAPEQRAL